MDVERAREVAFDFVGAVLFFLSISLFNALFIDPLKQLVTSDRVTMFLVWLAATLLLVYVFRRRVPWV